jgi:hypothetical protein
MKIRYQDGTTFEGVTLFRSQQTMRVVVKGGDDVMELNNIRGTWVSDDCEPVMLETGLPNKFAADYSDESFICSQALAEHLVSLLFIESGDDLFDEQGPAETLYSGISPLIA